METFDSVRRGLTKLDDEDLRSRCPLVNHSNIWRAIVAIKASNFTLERHAARLLSATWKTSCRKLQISEHAKSVEQ